MRVSAWSDVGAGVTTCRAGDRVLNLLHHLVRALSLLSEADVFRLSTRGLVLGNTIDGTQADYAGIPHADTSLYAIPADGEEESLVMLSDILPLASNGIELELSIRTTWLVCLSHVQPR